MTVKVGGALNIEGNCIWPRSSGQDILYGRTTCSSKLLVTLTSWRSYFIGMWNSYHDVNFINTYTNCSYCGAGCQGLPPIVLRALIDPELGMFGVFWTSMCRSKVKRWKSARWCWRTLTWRGVGRRWGVDLRQDGVATTRAGLLGGASLKEREREERGGREISDVRGVNKLTTSCYWSSTDFTL